MVAEVEIQAEVVEQYQRDGAVLVKSVFSPSWVNKVRDGIMKNLEKPSQYSERLVAKEGEGTYFDDYCNWSWIEEFRDYVFNSPASYLAATFMKSSEVSFYHEHVLNKEPGTSKRTPWHHDQAYYPIDGEKPGDVIIFHMKTVHGAPGNTSSNTHRRVLSTRWLGDDAVLATRPWEVSPPITGGLKPGQRAVCDTFPIVYSSE
ncbi:uncharacterized protein LOC134764880 isoform X3 [Penaeus indicus]|uniref:uncharacterized protein LOC134764880 isoform X3 n=1 Tax=Penaeus indicus TaxID=29960 RepID=UPI00300CC9FD